MPKVSIFNNIETVTNPKNVDIFDYFELIRDGEWMDITIECRGISDKELQKEFKDNIPTVTMSGTFSRRNDTGIIQHSGFIAMDIDDVEYPDVLKRKLSNDKFVLAVWTSIGGKGLRVIFKIDPKRHRDAFRGISAYIFNTFGESCEQGACISESKPYLVAYDPLIYIHPEKDVPMWKSYIKEVVVKHIPSYVHNNEDFESVLNNIKGKNIDICDTYEDWLKVCFAITEAYGENGRGYFHDISSQSNKYSPKVCNKQFNSCLKARGNSKANIPTFYYLAKQAGINIQTENTRIIVRSTTNGKRAGLSKDQIVENLKKFSSIENAAELVEKVFDAQDADEYSDDDNAIVAQLEMFINNNYQFKRNEVTGYIENNGSAMSETDMNSVFIAAKKLIPKLDFQLMKRLINSDFIESYNPFFKFFGSDGMPVTLSAIAEEQEKFESPLIDLFASCVINTDYEYTVHFIRKWMVGCISAAHKIHSPLILVLIGPQYSGKTEYLRRMVPKELTNYYAESKLDKEKDDELLMTESLWVMDDEYGGKSKQDANKLKKVSSAQYFYLRRPYGTQNEKVLRYGNLCGTSNIDEIFYDTTGNRRTIAITVTSVKRDLYNSIDKKELWMEAYRLYKDGFDWRVTDIDMAYLNKYKTKHESIVKERELISRYFKPNGKDLRLSTSDILVEIEKNTGQKLSVHTLNAEMKNLGFELKSTRVNAYSTPKMWAVSRINRDESKYGNDTDEEIDLPF